MLQINATAYKEGISKIVGSNNMLDFTLQYLYSLPQLAIQGDYFAIMISLILVYFILIILHKVSGLFLIVTKKIMSLAITVLALLFVYTKFMNNLDAEGLTINTLIIGTIGIMIAILGTIISFYSLFKNTKKAISAEAKKEKPAVEKLLKEEKAEIDLNQLKDFKTFFSLDSLKNDKSLLSVLTFLVVAEFGVFSSVTITAPSIRMGVIILLIFLVLSFIFIKQSYRNYKKGLLHIIVTFVLGSILAVVLGHYWSGIEWPVLFSLEIFKTACTVALISGMALSLFAGSRS